MADGLIVQTQKAIADLLESKISRLKRVEHIAGGFDEDTTTRIVTNSGVVHLAFIGVSNAEQLASGYTAMFASYGAYVTATGRDRHFEAVNTLEAIATVLAEADRGDDSDLMVPFSEGPVVGQMEVIYDKGSNGRGMAIYGLSFVVKLTIGKASFADDLTILDPDEFVKLRDIDEEGAVEDPANPPEGRI